MLEDLMGCCVLKLPPHVMENLGNLRSSVFDSQMVPKSWASQYSSVPFVDFPNGVRSSTFFGHLEMRFPPDLEDHGMVQIMENLRGTVKHLLRLCGVGLDDQADYHISDVCVHVSFLRSRRLPFQSSGHSLSGPFEEIFLVYPLCCGRPIALWNPSLPLLKHGTPPIWMPEIRPGHVLVFTELPYCYLSTTKCEEGLYANAYCVIRVSANAGYIGSNPQFARMVNSQAEHLLQSSSQQPPISKCVVCKGPIRERHHGILGGPRHLQDMACSLFHCVACRQENPWGEFYLCEVCVRSKLSPMLFNETHVMSQPPNQSALRNACEAYFSSPKVCCHDNLFRNDLVDTLFLLIKPNEIIAGSRVFLDFYLNATWHEAFVPPLVRGYFDAGRMQELWPAFYQCFVANSECPRVRMICYAVQCAMNTGPVMRRQGTSLPTYAREIYFSGDLRSRYNRHGIDACVVPRVLNAADFAHGLFSFDVLKIMAIRIFKLLSDDSKFSPSLVCCCSEPSQAEWSYNSLSCRGPVLDLSEDLGQPHHRNNSAIDRSTLSSLN